MICLLNWDMRGKGKGKGKGKRDGRGEKKKCDSRVRSL